MKVVLIDGQGGRLGQLLAEAITAEKLPCELLAIGTNSIATSAMLKGGADQAATGENAVRVNAKKADVIIGPIAIVIADALLGEITPGMAVAVGQSDAQKLLIPAGHCSNTVIGAKDLPIKSLLCGVIDELKALL